MLSDQSIQKLDKIQISKAPTPPSVWIAEFASGALRKKKLIEVLSLCSSLDRSCFRASSIAPLYRPSPFRANWIKLSASLFMYSSRNTRVLYDAQITFISIVMSRLEQKPDVCNCVLLVKSCLRLAAYSRCGKIDLRAYIINWTYWPCCLVRLHRSET